MVMSRDDVETFRKLNLEVQATYTAAMHEFRTRNYASKCNYLGHDDVASKHCYAWAVSTSNHQNQYMLLYNL